MTSQLTAFRNRSWLTIHRARPLLIAYALLGSFSVASGQSAATADKPVKNQQLPALPQLAPEQIQEHTIALADKIAAATVGIVLSDEDIEHNIGFGGSGVIVSPEGRILTAAHVLEGADDEVVVLLAKNRQVRAKVVGYLARGDLGIVQLVDEGPWPYLPLADVETLAPGTICLGAGHTGRIDADRPPPVRMGRVLGERKAESFIDELGERAELDRVLVTDAPFLPGDSGGPLVNLQGEVIGVHTSIGPDHRENLHVPVWQFHRHWAALLAGSKRTLPKAEVAVEEESPEDSAAGEKHKLPVFDYRISVERSWSICHHNYLHQFNAMAKPLANCVAQLFVDDRPVALGVVVDAHGLVVVPATSLAKKMICRIGEHDYEGTHLATDESQNLALLAIEATDLTPVTWSSNPTPSVGSYLVSVGMEGKPLAASIVSSPTQAVPDLAATSRETSHGFLGVEMQTRAKNARISRVLPKSAAAKAGLLANDLIVALNENAVQHGDELIETLRKFKAGDTVRVDLRRDSELITVEATLGRRPTQFEEDEVDFAAWSRTSGGTSQRKSNFPQAITHHGCISPTHCGSPVIDLQGNIVALNIARVDRTATLALPATTAAESIAKLKTKAGR